MKKKKVKIVINQDQFNNLISGLKARGKAVQKYLKYFKESNIHILHNIMVVADKGFQGIVNIPPFSITPLKKTKKRLLDVQKIFNEI